MEKFGLSAMVFILSVSLRQLMETHICHTVYYQIRLPIFTKDIKEEVGAMRHELQGPRLRWELCNSFKTQTEVFNS